MSNKESNSRPVWYSPVWITSIVGLIGCFLTIPETVSNYFEKTQNIESLRLDNIESKQRQELVLVEKTLSQQGGERVFLLRYLAETVDDEKAKVWAASEVTRLDKLAMIQNQFSELSKKAIILQKQVDKSTGNSKALEEKLAGVQSELSAKQSKIIELKRNAGLENTNMLAFVITVVRSTPLEKNVYLNLMSVDSSGIGNLNQCYSNICHLASFGEAPKGISIGLIKDNTHFITIPKDFDYHVAVSSFPVSGHYSYVKSIDYDCKYSSSEEISCTQKVITES